MKRPLGQCNECGGRLWGSEERATFCPDCDVDAGTTVDFRGST